MTGEMKHALNLSKPEFVFVSASVAKIAVSVCKQVGFVKNVILIDDGTTDGFVLSLSDLIKKHEGLKFDVYEHVRSFVDIRDQTCLIFCSSGTTGLPKGVQITHENFMSSIQSYRTRLRHLKEIYQWKLVAFNVAPWFHALGFVTMLMYCCMEETSYVFLPRFEERAFYRGVEVRF